MSFLRIATLALLVLLVASATPRTCLVVGIADGDTLTARCGQPGAYEQVKVRLAEIDAPDSISNRRLAYVYFFCSAQSFLT